MKVKFSVIKINLNREKRQLGLSLSMPWSLRHTVVLRLCYWWDVWMRLFWNPVFTSAYECVGKRRSLLPDLRTLKAFT